MDRTSFATSYGVFSHFFNKNQMHVPNLKQDGLERVEDLIRDDAANRQEVLGLGHGTVARIFLQKELLTQVR